MITDPLHPDLVHAAQGRLSRGFSYLSNPHASPLLSSFGAAQLAARSAGSRSHLITIGLRLVLTLSPGVS